MAEAFHRLQAAGFRFPFKVGLELGPWTSEQAAALERILGGDILRRIQMGSFEISEWLRRRLQEQLGSAVFSAFSPRGRELAGREPAGGRAAERVSGLRSTPNSSSTAPPSRMPRSRLTANRSNCAATGLSRSTTHSPTVNIGCRCVAVSAAGDEKRAVDLTFERKTEDSARDRRGQSPRNT